MANPDSHDWAWALLRRYEWVWYDGVWWRSEYVPI